MKLVDYLKTVSTGKELEINANLGYVYVPNCIRRCLRLSQEEKQLLFEIYCLYNEEKGYAYPTQQTLAMYMGTSSSSVSKTLKQLEEKGFIRSTGLKGKKKKYYLLMNLSSNPYVVLSEAFHFATKVINKQLEDNLKADWGDKLLQVINVSKKEEFTDLDKYGQLIREFPKRYVTNELLEHITKCVSLITNVDLKIDWAKAQAEHKEKVEKQGQKSIKNQIAYASPKQNKLALEADDEWLRYNGYLD